MAFPRSLRNVYMAFFFSECFGSRLRCSRPGRIARYAEGASRRPRRRSSRNAPRPRPRAARSAARARRSSRRSGTRTTPTATSAGAMVCMCIARLDGGFTPSRCRTHGDTTTMLNCSVWIWSAARFGYLTSSTLEVWVPPRRDDVPPARGPLLEPGLPKPRVHWR